MNPLDYRGSRKGVYELVELNETLGPLTYPVSDHLIKTYAYTQDDYHPWYFSDGNPFGRRVAHPTLLANPILQIFLTVYDPDTIVGLHTQEELWFHSPAYLDERVVIEGRYVEKYERRGKGYCVMEASATTDDGRPVMTHRGIEIMHILPGSIKGEKTAVVEGDVVTGEYDASLPPAEKASAALQPGQRICPLAKQTTTEQTQLFSGVGWHYMNIHTNLKIAHDAGYPELVVQGQQQVGYVVEMLTNFFGASWFTTGHIKMKMVRRVFVGETLRLGGVVRSKVEEDGKTRLFLHVWSQDSAGNMTVVGWADACV